MSEGYGANQYLPAAWYPAGLTAADVPPLFCPPGPEHGSALLAELHHELAPDHELYGLELEPYLRSSPSGPVLFRRLDAVDSFVAVQLAWSGPGAPRVVFAGSWRDFLTYCEP